MDNLTLYYYTYNYVKSFVKLSKTYKKINIEDQCSLLPVHLCLCDYGYSDLCTMYDHECICDYSELLCRFDHPEEEPDEEIDEYTELDFLDY